MHVSLRKIYLYWKKEHDDNNFLSYWQKHFSHVKINFNNLPMEELLSVALNVLITLYVPSLPYLNKLQERFWMHNDSEYIISSDRTQNLSMIDTERYFTSAWVHFIGVKLNDPQKLINKLCKNTWYSNSKNVVRGRCFLRNKLILL